MVKKKKKLTPAERAELARQEEERLSRIEKELTDPTRTPESAEQFERLLLANPNCSEMWARYITFYIAVSVWWLSDCAQLSKLHYFISYYMLQLQVIFVFTGN